MRKRRLDRIEMRQTTTTERAVNHHAEMILKCKIQQMIKQELWTLLGSLKQLTSLKRNRIKQN